MFTRSTLHNDMAAVSEGISVAFREMSKNRVNNHGQSLDTGFVCSTEVVGSDIVIFRDLLGVVNSL